MSSPRPQTIPCPDCGAPIKFTLWQSINTDMDFALADIISGKLFQIECGNCGYKTRVDYPILFNDMKHGMMIYYSDPDGIQEAEKACNDILGYGMRARIVTSQNELREKAMMLNDGLDDRLVEILKFFVFPQIQEHLSDHQIEHVYYDGTNGKFDLAILYDNGSAVMTVPREQYEEIKQKIGPLLDDKNTPLIVDQDWAVNFLGSIHQCDNED